MSSLPPPAQPKCHSALWTAIFWLWVPFVMGFRIMHETASSDLSIVLRFFLAAYVPLKLTCLHRASDREDMRWGQTYLLLFCMWLILATLMAANSAKFGSDSEAVVSNVPTPANGPAFLEWLAGFSLAMIICSAVISGICLGLGIISFQVSRDWIPRNDREASTPHVSAFLGAWGVAPCITFLSHYGLSFITGPFVWFMAHNMDSRIGS